MKKGIIIKLLSFAFVLTIVFSFAACGAGSENNNESGKDETKQDLNFDIIYSAALDRGFDGTLEELIEAFKGESAYAIAVAQGYSGSETEWLLSLNGAKGKDGLTPSIGSNGNWIIGGVDTGVRAEGKDGKNGTNGTDGITPHIGSNGNWWIGDFDSGIFVFTGGADGTNGLTPYIGTNGNWFIGNIDTGVSAAGKDGKDGEDGKNGEDGLTPNIGSNGNWWIGDVDTGIKAQGASGTDGKNGVTPHIGSNGNWWIGYVDTGVNAKGSSNAGLSAYEIYIKYHPEYEGNEEQWINDLANGKLVRYTVLFDVDGGSAVSSIKNLKKGVYIDEPDVPVKDDYEFLGWYKDNKYSFSWNFTEDTVNDDITLYAKWVYIRTVGLEFSPINNGAEYALTGRGIVTDNVISVPRFYNGKPVTQIAKAAFYYSYSLKSITIPSSVTTIDDEAFIRCYRLASVIFEPDSALKSIGKSAFWGCDGLITFKVPEGVTTIGIRAFSNCHNLVSITLPENLTKIETELFQFCENLSVVTIPANVTKIESSAFYVNGLKSITFAENSKLAEISSSAFAYCYYLKNVELPASLQYLGTNAFIGCESLKKVSFQKNSKLTQIQDKAFCNTTITKIVIPKSVTYIGNGAFASSELTQITFEDGINNNYALKNGVLFNLNQTEIVCYPSAMVGNDYTVPTEITSFRNYAFYHNRYLININFESGNRLATIGEFAFSYSEKLKNVNFRSDNVVKTIANSAFAYCAKLTGITIPSGLLSLGNSAFEYCSSLESATIPVGVNTVPNYIFQYCESLKTINLHSEITKIGRMSFAYTAIKSFTIPRDVTLIDYYAFEYSALREVDYESGSVLSTIESRAFGSCKNLVSMKIPESLMYASYVFSDAGDNLVLFLESNIPFINIDGFSGRAIIVSDSAVSAYKAAWPRLSQIIFGLSYNTVDSELVVSNGVLVAYYGTRSSVTITGEITEIKEGIFKSSKNLHNIYVASDNNNFASVNGVLFDKALSTVICYPAGKSSAEYLIPSGTLSIGNYAFYGCTELNEVIIPDSVEKIGNFAFYGCSGLLGIEFTENINSIGFYAFYGCSGIIEIDIPRGLTLIQYFSFAYTGIKTLFIPNSLTGISNCAFAFCIDLTSVVFEDNGQLQETGIDMFYNCQNLSEVNFGINPALTVLGDGTFSLCKALKEINLPDSLKIIDYDAFIGSGLESIVIPKSVTFIDNYAFENCTNLKSIIFEEDSQLIQIGFLVFSGCVGLESIILPAKLEIIDKAFTGLLRDEICGIMNIYVDESNPYFSSIDGVLFSKDRTILVYYPVGRTDTLYTVPDSVEVIGASAFSYCLYLEKIILPDSLVSIEEKAFYNCSALITINIPASVTSIGRNAFSRCESLLKMYFEENSQLNYIGYSAFYVCENLMSIVIPEKVTVINNSAFYFCDQLTSITILGTEVITLASDALGRCDKLSAIYFLDTATLNAYKSAPNWSAYASIMSVKN